MSWCRIPADEQVWEAYAESYDHILTILPFYQEAVGSACERAYGCEHTEGSVAPADLVA